jgi:hypothetical protein
MSRTAAPDACQKTPATTKRCAPEFFNDIDPLPLARVCRAVLLLYARPGTAIGQEAITSRT